MGFRRTEPAVGHGRVRPPATVANRQNAREMGAAMQITVDKVKRAVKNPGMAAEVIKKKAAVQLSHRLLDGYSLAPDELTLYLTYRCNLRCKMCDIWGESGFAYGMEKDSLDQMLTFDRIKEIIDEIADWKPKITLIGGETLLYRELYPLLEYLKRHELRVHIITNGMLLGRYAEVMVKEELVEHFTVSVDGLPDTHDQIRGGKDIFKRALAGIRTIDKYKQQLGKDHPIININFVVSTWNYHQMRDFADLMVQEGVGIGWLNFQHLQYTSADIAAQHNRVFKQKFGTTTSQWDSFVIEDVGIDPDKLVEHMHRVKEGTYPFRLTWLPDLDDEGIKAYYSDHFNSNRRCISPWAYAAILPSGNVSPCLQYNMGNLHEQSFKEIWNNEKYVQFRREVKKGLFPVCDRCCFLWLR
jgi:MoaA/NifB/PqqE/SkfB family radical SAM enzyme